MDNINLFKQLIISPHTVYLMYFVCPRMKNCHFPKENQQFVLYTGEAVQFVRGIK
jgi:hypothetical protein